MYKILLTSFVLLAIASSCTIDPCLTKGQFINGYDTFTEKVSNKHDDYSKSEWKDKDATMDQFVGECYPKFEEKLTDTEKKSFWLKYVKYKYDRHGRNILRSIERDVERYELQLDEELVDLFDDPQGELEDLFKEIYGDDIDKALDDFKKGVDDFSDQIRKWLEK